MFGVSQVRTDGIDSVVDVVDGELVEVDVVVDELEVEVEVDEVEVDDVVGTGSVVEVRPVNAT